VGLLCFSVALHIYYVPRLKHGVLCATLLLGDRVLRLLDELPAHVLLRRKGLQLGETAPSVSRYFLYLKLFLFYTGDVSIYEFSPLSKSNLAE
jgi:hypothetical protein